MHDGPVTQPEVRLVAVGGGVDLHALLWAGGERSPFLLVHGLSSNCRTWTAVAGRLHAAGHPVAAVDLRGHGRSDKPDEGYDFATLAADLATAADALGLVRPIAAGQSTGGNVVVELAYGSSSGTVPGAVGIDGGAIELSERWPRWEDCAAALAPPPLEGTPVADVEAWLRGAHPDWDDWGIEATLANLEVRANGTVGPWLTRERHMQLLRALWEHRPSKLLAAVGVPVMLVHAQSSGGGPQPPHASVSSPHVTVTSLVGDHDLHVQQPDTVARLLEEFASSVERGRTP